MNNNSLNINKIKTHLIFKLLYRWSYLGTVTEGFNSSDVFGIRRSFYTNEFEIKLTKNDLLQEVNIISRIIKNKTTLGCGGSRNKVYKHADYLGYEKRYFNDFIPNEFNFVVPKEFEYLGRTISNKQ